jgi:trk system potassium uptake protein TrkA
VPKAWDNKTLAELDIRKKHNLNVIAVKAKEQLVLPTPDMILNSEDAVLLLGNMKDIQRVF